MKYGYSDIFYENGDSIPTVTLGNGSVNVHSLASIGGGQSGIAFSDRGCVGEIGEDTTSSDAAFTNDLGVYMQILFTNPDSIDVMIEKLQTAKEYLTNLSANNAAIQSAMDRVYPKE